jgi:hypothetical protein
MTIIDTVDTQPQTYLLTATAEEIMRLEGLPPRIGMEINIPTPMEIRQAFKTIDAFRGKKRGEIEIVKGGKENPPILTLAQSEEGKQEK